MSIPGVSRHARDRMLERHGRDLTRAEWIAVVSAILDRKALLVRSTPGHGDLYDVTLVGITLRVAWNPTAGIVTTVLADHSATSRRAQLARKATLRTTVRIGRGWYDKDGNRL